MKIPKYLYYCIDISYQLICCGLMMWQIISLSQTYFKYLVVSTTLYHMPGKETVKAINVCFSGDQVLDYDRYVEMIKNGRLRGLNSNWNESSNKYDLFNMILTIEERFNVSFDRIDSDVRMYFKSIKYMLSNYVCYHMIIETRSPPIKYLTPDLGSFANYMKPDMLGSVEIDEKKLVNATHAYIAITEPEKLASKEYLAIGPFEFKEKDNHVLDHQLNIHISSYYYEFYKQPPPYVDQCADYTLLGYQDVEDAVSDCANEKLMKHSNFALRHKIFTSGINSSLYMVHSSEKVEACREEVFIHDDCYSIITFTDLRDVIRTGRLHLFITEIMSLKPSYTMFNTPKVDNVDYITMVFGTAGMWFGFSFLLINPANFFTKYSKINPDSKTKRRNAITGSRRVKKKVSSRDAEIIKINSKIRKIIKYLKDHDRTL